MIDLLEEGVTLRSAIRIAGFIRTCGGGWMTLVISNSDVGSVLTMRDTIDVLEQAYADLIARESVCRPRIDIQIPTRDFGVIYQWGTMEGGSTRGYFAIRMKSDVTSEREYRGVRVHDRYCIRPGLYCGLIFLTSINNGEPLALMKDRVLQRMRVGADGGIGTKYMSRPDAEVVGMLGAGGMARTHMDAFMLVRNIKKLQIFSPTPERREQYAEEMRRKHGIEVVVCEDPRDVYRGADIVAGCTSSSVPVLRGEWLEPGQHILNVGAVLACLAKTFAIESTRTCVSEVRQLQKGCLKCKLTMNGSLIQLDRTLTSISRRSRRATARTAWPCPTGSYGFRSPKAEQSPAARLRTKLPIQSVATCRAISSML